MVERLLSENTLLLEKRTPPSQDEDMAPKVFTPNDREILIPRVVMVSNLTPKRSYRGT